jgi:hypothetical protein
MKPARLIGATAALAVGLALFSPGGVSRAAWHDEVELPATTIATGELQVKKLDSSADRSGGTVTVTATSELHIQGDALAADLTLALTGFARPDGSPADVQVVTESTGGRLDGPKRQWRVDESYDGITVTARITMPASQAKALTGQPRVTWQLAQAAPAQGWSSAAVHEVSLAGLWPDVPAFPRLACTSTGSNGLTMRVSWVWNEAANVTWQFYRINAGDQSKAEPFDVTPRLGNDGVYVAEVSAQNTNGKFTYFVRATWTDENGQLRQQDSDIFGIRACGSGT